MALRREPYLRIYIHIQNPYLMGLSWGAILAGAVLDPTGQKGI